MKSITLSFIEAFNAMRFFLSLYLQSNKSADIAILLSSLRLFKDKPDWEKNPTTWDHAAWDDWVNGVNKTLKDLQIPQDYKNVLYDEWIAFLCMKNYLSLFYQEISYEDIKILLTKLNSIQNTENKNNDMWNLWLQAINFSLHDTYSLDRPLNR